ncbi:tautomerase family protein [Jongsikchunia kroppenstedtii]|uniref:tautomerase family protein n=1 Tax=Jongsikchunia kroppenstedtii TaxID=1121721 RepID=UPI000376BA60
MPLVEITLAQKRTPEEIRSLLRQVHEAVKSALSVPDEKIRVVIREVPSTHWSSGGVTIAEREAQQ